LEGEHGDVGGQVSTTGIVSAGPVAVSLSHRVRQQRVGVFEPFPRVVGFRIPSR
jgi:hypothetical protein